MQPTLNVDFGRAASDYRRFRAGFPDKFFEELERRSVTRKGGRTIDIGTGTGTVARGLAQRGVTVVGVDPSAELLAEARKADRAAGVQVNYVIGRAEALPFPNASSDVVAAGQCWHWFDRPTAAAEMARVLKPGGRLVIAHFDWLPLPGNVVAATEELILKHNPAWDMASGTGFYPEWLRDMGVAGFVDIETFSFDTDQLYSHAAWRGRIRASAGVRATLDERKTEEFDKALAVLLSSRFADDPLTVPHRVWVAIGTRP